MCAFSSRARVSGGVGEKEGEVEVKVEATRCRDIGCGPMVATRARWRVGSFFCSCSCSDSEGGWGCGDETEGEKTGSEGELELSKSREAWEAAGEMGSTEARYDVDVDVNGGEVGDVGVGVGERETP